MTAPLLELDDVAKLYKPQGSIFTRSQGQLRAVDGVSLHVMPGETVGIVGESGCGKSTVARMAVGLEHPTSGTVRWRGRDLRSLNRQDRTHFHRSVQLIFQDPYASLNPRRRIGESIAEGIRLHGTAPRDGVDARVESLLVKVGLDPSHATRFPYQFSGGQLQRIGIARALAVEPEILVCDEAVSALDVSVRAQVLNLLVDLQDELGLALVFIAHDLDIVEHMSDRILAMYLGRIIESGECSEVYARAGHPYTRSLLSAIPRRRGDRGRRIVLEGDPPSPLDPPPGCPFHTRCYRAEDQCRTHVPALASVSGTHRAACHFALEVSQSSIGAPRQPAGLSSTERNPT